MRPRINTPTPAIGPEIYSIKGLPRVYFYKRVEAILQTKEVAIKKQTPFVILLNGCPFIQFETNGKYAYIYDPEKDKKSSPALKQLFRDKKIAIN